MTGPNREIGFRTVYAHGVDLPLGPERRAAVSAAIREVRALYPDDASVAVTFGVEPGDLIAFEW